LLIRLGDLDLWTTLTSGRPAALECWSLSLWCFWLKSCMAILCLSEVDLFLLFSILVIEL